jgi:tetratricopeptide (TPR) repeat protein
MLKRHFHIVIIILIVLLSFNVFAAEDLCRVAKDVEKKAAAVFKNDMKEGLKLFIKAANICDSKDIKYNLGIAFYKYGNTLEAEKYLKQAVDKNSSSPVRLNNLASVLLANGSDYELAVELARKALKLNKDFKPALDTIARALFAAGQRLEALKTINEAIKKYSGEAYLKTTKQEIVSGYTAHFLFLIKSGNTKAGLSGLKKADFESSVALVYCQVLSRLGQAEKALQMASQYQGQFRSNQKFKDLYNEIMSRQIQEFYIIYKQGNENRALALSKDFSEKYPKSPEAKKAYDELFNAFIETGDIKVPQTRVAKKDSGTNLEVDSLLASIGTLNKREALNTEDTSLIIDVDSNIPRGKRKNKYAVALLIGNQKYEKQNKGLPDVKYAERDVAVMAKYLKKTLGYADANIIVRTNITSGDFRTLLGTDQNPRGKIHNYLRSGAKSDVFIYYVGHGVPGPKGGSAYLVPVDASADYIRNNGYPLELFYKILENLPAKSKTIVLDACFSGYSPSGFLLKKVSPAMLKTSNPAKNISNTAMFCAADKDQVATWYPAKRHSLFSYFFLKGIQGAADADKDKIIRLKELENYLKEEVPYQALRESNRTQTPLVTGNRDFVIAEFE